VKPKYSNPGTPTNPFEQRITSLLWECSGEYANKCDSCPVRKRCQNLFDDLPAHVKLEDYDAFLVQFTKLKEKRIEILKRRR